MYHWGVNSLDGQGDIKRLSFVASRVKTRHVLSYKPNINTRMHLQEVAVFVFLVFVLLLFVACNNLLIEINIVAFVASPKRDIAALGLDADSIARDFNAPLS